MQLGFASHSCPAFLNNPTPSKHNKKPKVLTSNEITQIVNLEFSNIFYDDSVYKAGFCSINVRRFLEYLQLVHPYLDFSDFKVHVFNRNDNTKHEDSKVFYVKKARSQKSEHFLDFKNWRYHVVIEFRDKIYDFDYTKRPTPVSKSAYLEDMFLSSSLIQILGAPFTGGLESLEITTYSAKEYLELYDEGYFNYFPFKARRLLQSSCIN